MQWSGMAVVQPHATEVFGCDLCVLLHVRPQVRTVLGFTPIAKLYTVPPTHQLPPQIYIRACWKEGRPQLSLVKFLHLYFIYHMS